MFLIFVSFQFHKLQNIRTIQTIRRIQDMEPNYIPCYLMMHQSMHQHHLDTCGHMLLYRARIQGEWSHRQMPLSILTSYKYPNYIDWFPKDRQHIPVDLLGQYSHVILIALLFRIFVLDWILHIVTIHPKTSMLHNNCLHMIWSRLIPRCSQTQFQHCKHSLAFSFVDRQDTMQSILTTLTIRRSKSYRNVHIGQNLQDKDLDGYSFVFGVVVLAHN